MHTRVSARSSNARRAAAALVLCLAGAACTPPTPSPLLGLRPNLGGLAVASAPESTPALSALPAKGSGEAALRGAGEGLKVGGAIAISGRGDAALLSIPLGLATAIVAAPVGAIIGAGMARSPAEVEAAEAAIRKALSDMPPHRGLAAAIRAHPLLASGLKAPETVEAGAYTALVSRGVGTVVEVAGARYGLEKDGLGAADPDFRLVLVVRVRLVRAADNIELYNRAWRYTGASHSFFAWAEGGGARVRAELEHAYRDLAARIARHLLADPEPAQVPVIEVSGRSTARQ